MGGAAWTGTPKGVQHEIAQARQALEDFCMINPNLLKGHQAYLKFLNEYAKDDQIHKCKTAARILMLGKSFLLFFQNKNR